MRIGIDHRPALAGPGGISVYVRELVAALAAAFPGDRLELYAHRMRQGAAEAVRAPAGARLHRSRVPAPAMALAARAGLGADRVLGAVDVLHLTDYASLRSSRAPVVATIHDVLFDELPDCYSAAMRDRLRAVTTRICRDAAQVIVPAARVRTALRAGYNVAADRVHVVPHGLTSLPDARPAEGLGRYVLHVGMLQPRKNLVRLMEAVGDASSGGEPVNLVLVGRTGWMDDDIRAHAEALPHVHLEGAVDRSRLASLYAGAALVAVPSLGEGFGLPVLEAMGAGRPVLVAQDTACADLAGEAGHLIDPLDPADIARGIRDLLSDEERCARLGAAGRTRAAGYTWERTARATRTVYEAAIGG